MPGYPLVLHHERSLKYNLIFVTEKIGRIHMCECLSCIKIIVHLHHCFLTVLALCLSEDDTQKT